MIVAGSFLLTAYAADTGERVWWVRGLCFELKSTPVVSGDTLYINGFGTPQNQPGSQPAVESFEDIVRRYADATGTVTFANLPNGNARSWIDLDSNGVVSASEWGYFLKYLFRGSLPTM